MGLIIIGVIAFLVLIIAVELYHSRLRGRRLLGRALLVAGMLATLPAYILFSSLLDWTLGGLPASGKIILVAMFLMGLGCYAFFRRRRMQKKN